MYKTRKKSLSLHAAINIFVSSHVASITWSVSQGCYSYIHVYAKRLILINNFSIHILTYAVLIVHVSYSFHPQALSVIQFLFLSVIIQ